MYFTHWINLHLGQPDPPSSYLTETHARWIFNLLSRVEDHITADDMSLLRSVARSCLALLKRLLGDGTLLAGGQMVNEIQPSDLAESRMSERSCWMIVSLVVGIWGQQDIWIEATDMLTGLEP
jgi:Survival motor neuron (SMN) interacting protein 1 (SIP1)